MGFCGTKTVSWSGALKRSPPDTPGLRHGCEQPSETDKAVSMARPRKLEHELRTARLDIRLTEAELAHIHVQAHAAGLSASEYGRYLINGRKVKPAPSPVTADLVRELNAVGVNLNQITKYLHAGRPLSARAEDIFAKLESVVDRILAESHGP